VTHLVFGQRFEFRGDAFGRNIVVVAERPGRRCFGVLDVDS
jgi:hypothetical protein